MDVRDLRDVDSDSIWVVWVVGGDVLSQSAATAGPARGLRTRET